MENNSTQVLVGCRRNENATPPKDAAVFFDGVEKDVLQDARLSQDPVPANTTAMVRTMILISS
jgi:hypothetical protein